MASNHPHECRSNPSPRGGHASGRNFFTLQGVPISERELNDDDALIDATLAGDRAAFGNLVCRYQDRLYNTLVKLVDSREDARDLTQDAFVQALSKLESFKRASAFYTWLYRIAFNLAMTRRRRRRPVVSIDHIRQQSGEEPTAEQAGPSDGLLAQERASQVRHALTELQDEHRRILVLREVEGSSYEQISDILEIPVGTVRSRLFRARMQLRERLTAIFDDQTHPSNL